MYFPLPCLITGGYTTCFLHDQTSVCICMHDISCNPPCWWWKSPCFIRTSTFHWRFPSSSQRWLGNPSFAMDLKGGFSSKACSWLPECNIPSKFTVHVSSHLPSGKQTWQWNSHYLFVIFRIKHPFIGDFPLPCLITRGYVHFISSQVYADSIPFTVYSCCDIPVELFHIYVFIQSVYHIIVIHHVYIVIYVHPMLY